MCQDELEQFGVTEQEIASYVNGLRMADHNWQRFMQFNLDRVSKLLLAGKPLGRVLKGRIGFEMRMIIAGGERIITKLQKANGDVFRHRPTLHYGDWMLILLKALLKI
jgi:phytoene/squalene synthetase